MTGTIPYYVVRERHGTRRGYWCPTPRMKAAGFSMVTCGVDGPAARAEAALWTARWQAARDAARRNSDRDDTGPRMPASRDHGYVYFLRVGDRVKVGFSRTPFTRVGELAVGMPRRPEVVVAVRGTRLDEGRMHQRLAAFRCSGEWFRATPEVMRIVMRSLMFGRPMHGRDSAPSE